MKEPILQSDLLMNCYMKHMTRMKCSHWTTKPFTPYHFQPVVSPTTPMVDITAAFNAEHEKYVCVIINVLVKFL